MNSPSNLPATRVFASARCANPAIRITLRRPILAALAAMALATLAPSPLRAQRQLNLTRPPGIFIVGTNDKSCQDTLAELQRFIGEFAFVRGHHIYLVCDDFAWQQATQRLTRAYGVIVNSRAAISDIRERETWFYAPALRKGADGRNGEHIYAHELGHFVCSCIDEAAAEKAAAHLLDDARHNRFSPKATATASADLASTK